MDDIALELSRLRVLRGVDFVRQLKKVVLLGIFKPIESEKDIYAAAGNHRDDFPLLLEAARKAVARGNKVFRRKPVLHDSFPAEVRAIKKAALWRLFLDWGRGR